MEEQFTPIDGFENYAVSTHGRIQRLTNGPHTKPGKFKKPQINKITGYNHVKVSGSLGKRSMSLHKLVATHFIPNPNNYKEVDHIDRDKTNNRVDNLRWVTRRENMANMAGRRQLCPILAFPPDGSDPIQFETMRDAAKYIAEVIGERYFAQGICNVLNDPKRYPYYKGWRFERVSADN